MGFAFNIRKSSPQTTKHSSSAKITSVARPGSADAADPSNDESLSESSLAVAQSLWSRGNLSPLDALFGATAIVKLIPTAGFGFVGSHLGHRLQKYADDTSVAVDAAEADPTLTRLYAKNKSSIKTTEWKPDAALFKKKRHQAFIALQMSALSGPLEIIYGQCATGLKVGGKLFAADLMETGARNAGSGPDGGSTLRTIDEHVSSLKSVGFDIGNKGDLTENFLAAVRSGLLQSLAMLEDLRSPNASNRVQRTSAFALQLKTWKAMHGLAAARKIQAICILATRVR